MDKIKISAKTSIFELTEAYPEIKEIMVQLGFSDILKPMMLQTAGRYMNLEKGARLKKIGWEALVGFFAEHGFEISA
ncbi:MAG: DUF1858 domain-containing protein [Saccharofermentanales bacterium]